VNSIVTNTFPSPSPTQSRAASATGSGEPPTAPELDARERFCRTLVRTAGEIARRGFLAIRPGDVTMKGPQDFLTETDAAVEAHVRDEIARAFPTDRFLGEETGGERTSSQSVWVVDPIDGTANFARGIPHFCVAIAYVAAGRVRLGAIYNPILDELYFAREGRGAELNGSPIAVSKTAVFSAACLELGWSGRAPKVQYLRTVERLLDIGGNIRRGASGALGLAYVADGRSDGYAELHMQPWDCLAGLLLVSEAGGAVSPFLEVNGLEHGGAVLACTPALADDLGAATGIPLALA
jgi:myo-inositol-1(or 4)-monophosphatase